MGCLGGKTTLVENGLNGSIDILNNPLLGECEKLNIFIGITHGLNISLLGDTNLICAINPGIPTDYYLRVSKTILWLSPSDSFDILSNTNWEIK